MAHGPTSRRRYSIGIAIDWFFFVFAGAAAAWLAYLSLTETFRTGWAGILVGVLFWGLLAYLVLPRDLVESFARALSELFREGQTMQQVVLAQFMRQGHYVSHIRRMRQVYGERRRVLIDEIARRMGGALSVLGSDAGLHLVLGLPPGTDDAAITREALAAGVLTRPLSLYSLRPDPAPGLVLGYGAVTEEEIRHRFGLLADVIEPHLG